MTNKGGFNNIIEEIKSRCDIVDVIGSVVTLKKAGHNYSGCCPFHNEKTPSFIVSPDKQIFTCFGCNATGDVIEFVRRYYNLEFKEALEKLGKQCGVEVTFQNGNSKYKNRLYEINRSAAIFFYKALRQTKNPGLEYVIKRGLSKETLHDFGIGYADDSWNSLLNHLKSQGFTEEEMKEASLVSFSKGRYFDKFRNRVIFPIKNPSGKVIGFGGRAIGDVSPKYLNSMETPVFHKKNNLYGIDIAKSFMGEKNQAILVEGYMDVISLHQGGIKNVAASLGTALTVEQARLIKRYTNNAILCYDSDSAGINAAIRGSEILYKEGLNIKIMSVTDGKDPDDFIKSKGRLAFEELVENSASYADYRIGQLASRVNLNVVEERVSFLRNVSKFLGTLEPVERDIYTKKVAKKYSISEGALRGNTKSKLDSSFAYGGPNYEAASNEEKSRDENNTVPKMSLLEKNLIKIILTDSSYFDKIKGLGNVFVSETAKTIFDEICQIYTEGEEVDIDKLLDSLEALERAALVDINANIMLAGKVEEVYEECKKNYRDEFLAAREKELILRISIADEEENLDDIRRLTEELMDIQKEKNQRE